MVLGLVLVLAFGLVAIGERHPARAATGDSVVLAWNQQVVLDTIRGEDWLPYRPPGDPAPPFAEYASGHSTFSGTAAEVLTGFTGRANLS